MTDLIVNIVIDEGHLGQFQQIVERCEQAGLRVADRLETIGVVTGTIDSSQLPQIRRIAGVIVEEAREIHLPPPDAEVQ